MIVYLAELHYTYESTALIGIYSEQNKAKEACENAYQDNYYKNGESLVWKGDKVLSSQALPLDCEYRIYAIEVDA